MAERRSSHFSIELAPGFAEQRAENAKKAVAILANYADIDKAKAVEDICRAVAVVSDYRYTHTQFGLTALGYAPFATRQQKNRRRPQVELPEAKRKLSQVQSALSKLHACLDGLDDLDRWRPIWLQAYEVYLDLPDVQADPNGEATSDSNAALEDESDGHLLTAYKCLCSDMAQLVQVVDKMQARLAAIVEHVDMLPPARRTSEVACFGLLVMALGPIFKAHTGKPGAMAESG